ncbi:biotin-acetyl-CoA-carboxylase ligase [Acanthamoeba castellanii str. Neff]|uniref:Biotin-acetyl-CoA-carboxylase ligase n=1 Tax=Acanthamoeba castellanii (strain ATCC 30010 / Neff) TaxID=1257118 RepID=L8GJ71_ACACF|nr:biotin-acetyl-CoA-carboxylase ligase [Acanthamoeba castellanii str. Neff]ELR12899.1 biotin-acetyl-CoA-carboxylase ligase [Acanthamoeba castellanii str. Neff]
MLRALWNPAAHTNNLQILLLNDDTGFNFSSAAFAGSGLVDNTTLALLRDFPTISAGALITQELLTNPATADILDWKVQSPDLVDREKLEDCIEHGCAWGALYIPPDFSSTMFEAFGPINITELTQRLFFPDGAYAAYSNPIYFIYDEGRNYATLSIVVKIMDKIFRSVSSGISQKLLTTSLGPILLSTRAQFMVVAAYNHVLRALWAMVFAINQSLLITCVVAAVAGDASEDVFQHNFMAYWMWLFYVSICFIFMNATLAGILGITAFQLASTFMLILQLTSGGAMLSEYLMNEFYLIGHGLPFYYAVRGARTILFGSLENKMEENGLVIFGWAFGCLLASFLLSLLRMEKRWIRWQKNERVVGQILQSTVGSNATNFVVPPA